MKQATLTSGDASTKDPGGVADRGIRDGDVVQYIAARVRSVSLSVPASSVPGKKGQTKDVAATTMTLQLRSEASAPVSFTFHDVLPPSAPVGLAAIAGGGFGQPPSIDLSWEPAAEEDVVGYNIYRVDLGLAAEPTKPVKLTMPQINAKPVVGPAYRDLTARPGHTYRYRITAVDQRHHESEMSAEVVEQLNP